MKSVLFGAVIILLIGAGCKKDHGGSSSGGKTPGLQLITDGLVSPVAVMEPPDSTHRLFVVDETGKIWVVGSDGNPTLSVVTESIS